MTKNETLDWLYRLRINIGVYMPREWCIPMVRALDAAIKALEQEPCEDTVSRKGVNDLIDDCDSDGLTGIFCSYEDGERFKKMVKELPSVTPIRPKGHWIYDKSIENWICSECKETPKTIGYVGSDAFMAEHFKYCNHCGADMRG